MDPKIRIQTLADRVTEVEQHVSEGGWHPSADTLGIVLRHTAGILAALHAAIIVDVMASS